jgi:hypothetical protein
MTDLSGGIGFGALVVLGVLYLMARESLKTLAARSVAHEFDTRLESHKAQLQQAAEGVRFDFSRQLRDVELFAAKRHQVSAELFTAIRKADGVVRSLTGFRRDYDLERMGAEDIKGVMVEREVAGPIQREIDALLSTDKKAAVKELKTVLRRIEIAKARTEWHDAHNLLLLSEIYLSDAVEKAATNVLEILHKILLDAEYPTDPRMLTDKATVTPAIEALRVAMRSELGRGYSDDLSRTDSVRSAEPVGDASVTL